MKPSTVRPWLLLAIGMVTFGCGDEEPTEPIRIAEVVERTTESDEMALWLAGAAEVPAELSTRIAGELSLLRGTFGDSIPELRTIHFTLPWEPNRLWLELDAALYDSVEAGLSTCLDPINERLGGAIQRPLFGHGFRWIFIDFNRTVHPDCLAVDYQEVPGVTFANPDYFGGDWSNVYPEVTEEGSRYLVMRGAGDCPAGCFQSDFWYFRIAGGKPVSVGSYLYPYPATPPEWLREAFELRNNFHTRGFTCGHN